MTVMLESGWTSAQLRHVIAGRPLPAPVRTSVGAIIAARLRAAQAYPPPATLTGSEHTSDIPDDEPPTYRAVERSSTASAARTVTEALTYRALVEAPAAASPAKTSLPGLPRLAAVRHLPRPHSGGRCTTCGTTFNTPTEGSTP
ncbi:hypothetical protein ACFW4M_31625 [Streptomyces sp. NPDC058794]|uniref:hypothetical protein n=1 Tax=unclassified Streptomyces TaxID=2593676 RepID=UPI00369D35DD